MLRQVYMEYSPWNYQLAPEVIGLLKWKYSLPTMIFFSGTTLVLRTSFFLQTAVDQGKTIASPNSHPHMEIVIVTFCFLFRGTEKGIDFLGGGFKHS